MSFPEPPTKETLEDARRCLASTRDSIRELAYRIDAEEAVLARLVREHRNAISELQEQQAALEKQATRAQAYLSPIRRLPLELLREIFTWSFELHPSSAWVLAAVSTPWRKLALRMPLIWSKVSALSIFLAGNKGGPGDERQPHFLIQLYHDFLWQLCSRELMINPL